VVFEERRLRTEATPLGKFEESFNALIRATHPNGGRGRLAVGYIRRIPKRRRAFTPRQLFPQNITLVLVVDFALRMPWRCGALLSTHTGHTTRRRSGTLDIKRLRKNGCTPRPRRTPGGHWTCTPCRLATRRDNPLKIFAQLSPRGPALYKGRSWDAKGHTGLRGPDFTQMSCLFKQAARRANDTRRASRAANTTKSRSAGAGPASGGIEKVKNKFAAAESRGTRPITPSSSNC
jgi:hypothetical protein